MVSVKLFECSPFQTRQAKKVEVIILKFCSDRSGQNFISSSIRESASRSPYELSYHGCSYFSPTQVCFPF
ncbi:hypothetical protein Hanom_Chr16g01508051 [Helianthus anomalus]